ncbi:MAG: sulfide/dihydroorotate dehydrogenase-like FAD/NAD-binding protein [Elusimicrobia bacterium]|nr:sulfide/dihydroorotate dehydrogenase-like FAD/NAD-binding protein [Elusimicrobiota bacterium]
MENNGYKIVEKVELSPGVSRYVVLAPLVAKKARAGNFVIVRACEGAERIPVTVVDWDAQKGTITIIIQSVGKSTYLLNSFKQGSFIKNVVGPLGTAVEVKNYGTAIFIGGGVGIAEMYPLAKAFKSAGNRVISIMGARTKELLILEEEAAMVSDEIFICTDDGSKGEKGLVTGPLKKLKEDNKKIDVVFAVGPIKMMQAVAEITRPWGLLTYASLNPIMLDGTGMCGCCRVEVDKKTTLACVHGPVFNAHKVNFELLLSRTQAYLKQEKISIGEFKTAAER